MFKPARSLAVGLRKSVYGISWFETSADDLRTTQKVAVIFDFEKFSGFFPHPMEGKMRRVQYVGSGSALDAMQSRVRDII